MHKVNMRESFEFAYRIIALLIANFEQNYRAEFGDSDDVEKCEMRGYRVAISNIVIQLLDCNSIESLEDRIDSRIEGLRLILKQEKNELQRAAYMGEIRALYMFLSMLD